MRETGKVVSIASGRAQVEVAAKEECGHCSAHGVCNWTGTSVRKVLAVDRAGVKAGDLVEIEIGAGTGAQTNLLVFGIPVALMLGGVLLGGLVLRRDMWSAILAGVGLVLGFGIVKVIDIRANRSGRNLPVILGKTDEGRRQKSECRGQSDGSQNGGEADESVGGDVAGGSADDGVR